MPVNHPAPPPEPTSNWIVEVLQKVRHRPDLIAGLGTLTVAVTALCWIGMWGVPWPWRIPVVLIALLTLVGMTLGMLHDYTDPDERDSAAWLASQRQDDPPDPH